MHPATVGRLADPPFEPLGGEVERLVEVLRARLAAYHRPAGATGDLDVLAAAVLARVGLVLQFHVGPDDLVVVPLQLGELLADVLSVVIRNHDVAPANDDLHPAGDQAGVRAVRTRVETRRIGWLWECFRTYGHVTSTHIAWNGRDELGGRATPSRISHCDVRPACRDVPGVAAVGMSRTRCGRPLRAGKRRCVAATTAAPGTVQPAARSARAASVNVAPEVTMSSTTTAEAPGQGGAAARNAMARLAARASTSSPAESRTARASRNALRARRPRGSNRATWSPPRARRAAAADGTGTRNASG